jgi:hypothetical protein
VARREPVRRRLTASLGFDGIEFSYPAQRFGSDRRVGGLSHLIEASPCMAPACGEHDVAFVRQGLEADIAVDMEHALEVFQMRSWSFSSAVWREQINGCRRSSALEPAPDGLVEQHRATDGDRPRRAFRVWDQAYSVVNGRFKVSQGRGIFFYHVRELIQLEDDLGVPVSRLVRRYDQVKR